MKKANWFALLLAIFCLTGCAAPQAETQPTQTALWEAGSVTELSQTVTEEGRTLILKGSLELPEPETLNHIQLALDEEALERFVQDYIYSAYPDAKKVAREDGRIEWVKEDGEQFLLSFSQDITGDGYYLDVTRDLNGNNLDKEHTFERGYITPQIPGDLTSTAAEAAKAAGEEIARYSCFSFVPWNVTANVTEDGRGAYYAKLQPYFEGLPVTGYVPFGDISAHISEEGMFSCGGSFLLKEISREAIVPKCTLEEAAEKLKTDFLAHMSGDDKIMEVVSVNVQYFAEFDIDNICHLRPAWVFFCQAQRSGGFVDDLFFAYLMETGTLECFR